RVINEDIVHPRSGFSLHPHKNYEIFSYILKGTLTHTDTLQNLEHLGRLSLQFTSAGTGMSHSEMNHSGKEACHFLQIWVKPCVKETVPLYSTLSVLEEDLLCGVDGKGGPVPMIVPMEVKEGGREFRGVGTSCLVGIKQDFYFFAGLLGVGEENVYAPVGGLIQGVGGGGGGEGVLEEEKSKKKKSRRGYIHVAGGIPDRTARVNTKSNKPNVEVRLGSETVVLEGGDGVFIDGMGEEERLLIKGLSPFATGDDVSGGDNDQEDGVVDRVDYVVMEFE
ncbi:hypothetical protein HDU97_006474, partial [Phlyctochytrium planicorne]